MKFFIALTVLVTLGAGSYALGWAEGYQCGIGDCIRKEMANGTSR